MSFASDLLDDIDTIRAIPGELGLRDTSVTLIVRSWSGARIGMGVATTTETPIRVGGQNPRVTRIGAREALASGGEYQAGDFRIGPVTPDHVAALSPTMSGKREVFWKLDGPGLPDDGLVCEKRAEEHRELRIEFVLRATSAKL